MPSPRSKPATRVAYPTVKIEGADVPVVIDVNAWCVAESHFKKTTSEIVADLSARPNVGTIRYLLSLGLSNADTIYSEAEAGALLNEIGLTGGIEIIGKSVERIMGPVA